MSTVLEGSVDFVRHEDGRMQVLSAPPTTRISLELIAEADPVLLKIRGNVITFAGQVVYRVTAWDTLGKALIAELAEDRRPT